MPLLRTLPLRHNLNQVAEAFAGIVIIDVLRACTSTVAAFENGARAIYPCASREEAWRLREQLRRQAIDPLLCGERGGRKIETAEPMLIEHGYVIYDKFRKKQLPGIVDYLKGQGILLAGRYGRFEYAAMEDAIRQGKETADAIAGGKR